MVSDPIRALLAVVGILEELQLPYAIGGSVASSVFGEPRASADADLIVELAEQRLPELASRLEGGFYISEDAARDAIRRQSSFNIIHLESMYKIDMFVASSSTLDREQLSRRVQVDLTLEPRCSAYVTAAENVVLRKLDWYRQGSGISDQQWRDVLGVLKVQGSALDVDYLRRIAEEADLTALLERALAESGRSEDS